MARAEFYTVSDKERDVYSDFLINLNAHPHTKRIVTAKNVNSVKRALKNLLLTNKYERLYAPRFGGNLRKYLFEPVSAVLADAIKTDIEATIKNYEPRVSTENVIVSANPDEHSYSIQIVFSIRTVQAPISLDLTLYRVR